MSFERSTSRSFESSSSSQHIVNESLPIMLTNELPELDDDEPYREKYDQHGVRIENQVVIDVWSNQMFEKDFAIRYFVPKISQMAISKVVMALFKENTWLWFFEYAFKLTFNTVTWFKS